MGKCIISSITLVVMLGFQKTQRNSVDKTSSELIIVFYVILKMFQWVDLFSSKKFHLKNLI